MLRIHRAAPFVRSRLPLFQICRQSLADVFRMLCAPSSIATWYSYLPSLGVELWSRVIAGRFVHLGPKLWQSSLTIRTLRHHVSLSPLLSPSAPRGRPPPSDAGTRKRCIALRRSSKTGKHNEIEIQQASDSSRTQTATYPKATVQTPSPSGILRRNRTSCSSSASRTKCERVTRTLLVPHPVPSPLSPKHCALLCAPCPALSADITTRPAAHRAHPARWAALSLPLTLVRRRTSDVRPKAAAPRTARTPPHPGSARAHENISRRPNNPPSSARPSPRACVPPRGGACGASTPGGP